MTHTIRLGIPPGQGRPLLQRLAIVWAVALVIALVAWQLFSRAHKQQVEAIAAQLRLNVSRKTNETKIYGASLSQAIAVPNTKGGANRSRLG